jgi:hypothetical protein
MLDMTYYEQHLGDDEPLRIFAIVRLHYRYATIDFIDNLGNGILVSTKCDYFAQGLESYIRSYVDKQITSEYVLSINVLDV